MVDGGSLGRLPIGETRRLLPNRSQAKYVQFTTFFDPAICPGQRSRRFPWPYTEGLTIAEADHELAFLATGIYGKSLLNQNGAPIRLVVPWKYGFKGAKSLVENRLRCGSAKDSLEPDGSQ